MPYKTGLTSFDMYKSELFSQCSTDFFVKLSLLITEASHQWFREYPEANGHKQSPIDINPSDAVFDRHLAHSRLFLDYHASDFPTITNTGHTFMIPAKDGSTSSDNSKFPTSSPVANLASHIKY